MKVRLDYSAHMSVVVEVPGDDLDGIVEFEAMKIAEDYLHGSGVRADWELDDGGIDVVDDDEEAVNDF